MADPVLPSNAPDAGPYQPQINATAAKYGIDPVWFTRLLYQENRFRPQGTSPAGAQGFAQFMPGTAKRYGVDVNDPSSSIEGAGHYLSDNLKLFGGNVGLAVAGYNWGEGNVQNWLKSGGAVPKETQDYVANITGNPVRAWAGSGGASSRSARAGVAAPGPVDPSIVARGGVSPAIPGTTLTSTPSAGGDGKILPGFSDAKTSAKFQKDVGDFSKALGYGQGDQPPSAPPMGPWPIARNTSPLGGAMLPASQQLQAQLTGYQPEPYSYGHTLTSIAEPTQWGSAAPGQAPYAAAGQQAPAEGSPYGTSLAGLQMAYGLSPQQLQMLMSPMMLNQGGSSFG